jgi:8-oxo-dGTP pyrophosphatase MutT (NUDIX family)
VLKAVQRALHWGVRRLHRGRRLVWSVTRPETAGVHAVALTPAGKVVLVTLSYVDGWRLPGGGLKRGEDPRDAVLRELREEIGLTAHGEAALVTVFDHNPDFKKDRSSLFVVRDVQYAPRWSLEVAAVGEFPLDALPPDLSRVTGQLLREASPLL